MPHCHKADLAQISADLTVGSNFFSIASSMKAPERLIVFNENLRFLFLQGRFGAFYCVFRRNPDRIWLYGVSHYRVSHYRVFHNESIPVT